MPAAGMLKFSKVRTRSNRSSIKIRFSKHLRLSDLCCTRTSVVASNHERSGKGHRGEEIFWWCGSLHTNHSSLQMIFSSNHTSCARRSPQFLMLLEGLRRQVYYTKAYWQDLWVQPSFLWYSVGSSEPTILNSKPNQPVHPPICWAPIAKPVLHVFRSNTGCTSQRHLELD